MTTTVFSSSVISSGDDPIFSFAANGDRLVVNAGVTLSNRGDYAVYAPGLGPGEGLSDLHATIDGILSAPGSAALFAYGSSIDLTVGSTGRLESSRGMAFWASHDSSVANHGVMRASHGDGVVVESPTNSTVENWGSIFGRQGAVSFLSDDFTGVATVVNHGTLTAGMAEAVYSNAGTTFLANDGTILARGGSAAGVFVRGGVSESVTATIDNSGTIKSVYDYGILAGGSAALHVTNDGTIGGAKGSLASFWSMADTVTNNGQLIGRVALGGGDDIYHGESGRVTGPVWGQAGDDLLVGGAAADVLGGGSGDDTVTGGAGADTLTGSTGADRLSGGAGDDVFRFATASESVGDAIVASGGALAFAAAGATGGDRIDVSAIDANAEVAGGQHFVFGTSHGVGRLWAVDNGAVTYIRGNVAGDTAPEFELAINDGAGVHASDYAAVDFIL